MGAIFSNTLQFGIPYAILALGVFISYRILDFADMTTEGSFVLGGAMTIVLIGLGWNPLLAILVSIICGILAGLITGLLHTKLKINGLLAGIITMTGLFSINMVIFGMQDSVKDTYNFFTAFKSYYTIPINDGDPTIFGYLTSWFGWSRLASVIVTLSIIVLIVYGVIYWFAGTEVGMSMRATGMNPKMSRSQGINTTFYTILGLCISNALIAFAAALCAQRDFTMSTTSGTGMLVVGLASIIIGEAIFGKRSFLNWIISVGLGALVYYLIIAVAIELGLPNHYLKLLYAIIIVIILAIGFIKQKRNSTFSLVGFIKSLFTKKEKFDLEKAKQENEVLEINTNISDKEIVVKDNTILKVSSVTKIFNPTGNPEDIKIALNGIDVEIKEGEFVTIIGGNGSGKSTFFNTVSGVFPPDAGNIIIDDNDITKMPEYKRAAFIGRVAQDPYQGTAHNMSILENMNIANRRDRSKTLRWGFSKSSEKQFKEKLATLGLGLENRMSAKIGTLSGGQRQAVTLLMATLKRPDMLFLDEHTAALDPKTAKKVLDLTDSVVKENNLTCVMVTHNMRDAIKYGNRLLMFNNGRIIYDVSGDEKKNLTVEALLKKFEDVDFNDSEVLG